MVLILGKITGQHYLDLIPMQETSINSLNTLDVDQPKLLTFTDRHGRIIGDVKPQIVGDDSD